MKRDPKTPEERWAIARADDIALRLDKDWGGNYREKLGPRLARAVEREQVLSLVLGQAMEKYQPAIETALAVVRELEGVDRTVVE